ncbi:hypothetical protein GCM10008019_25760 [Deinococcus soli (ex Cha et al. 2016)]|nr:hypothetical protein GCM10008019_25760 [Deinococcus soli (ex Cha et al. 2016)]
MTVRRVLGRAVFRPGVEVVEQAERRLRVRAAQVRVLRMVFSYRKGGWSRVYMLKQSFMNADGIMNGRTDRTRSVVSGVCLSVSHISRT